MYFASSENPHKLVYAEDFHSHAAFCVHDEILISPYLSIKIHKKTV